MDSFFQYLQLKAFGRGLKGYHTAWLVVGVAVWMINRARHQNDVVYRTRLNPGERLIISASSGSSPSVSD